MSHELTLYVYPSPFGVNWLSPHHLTRSVVKNAISFRPRSIGHVSIELKAPGVHSLTGMSAVNFNLNRRLIFWDQLGLSVLFYQYPGKMENKEKLIAEKTKRLKKGNFSFIRFKISEESFRKVKQYLEEYQNQNIGKWYGLPLRPRYGEGAGCSAFGASFLEVAGIMQPEFKTNWSGQVRVPASLMAGKDARGAKVPVWNLLLPSKANLQWALPHEPGHDIFFWDPDMMHNWILKNANTREENAQGIFLDYSSKIPPNEPIWLK